VCVVERLGKYRYVHTSHVTAREYVSTCACMCVRRQTSVCCMSCRVHQCVVVHQCDVQHTHTHTCTHMYSRIPQSMHCRSR